MKTQTKLTHKREFKIAHYKQNDIDETEFKFQDPQKKISSETQKVILLSYIFYR